MMEETNSLVMVTRNSKNVNPSSENVVATNLKLLHFFFVKNY